jgi:hypothetical protein
MLRGAVLRVTATANRCRKPGSARESALEFPRATLGLAKLATGLLQLAGEALDRRLHVGLQIWHGLQGPAQRRQRKPEVVRRSERPAVLGHSSRSAVGELSVEYPTINAARRGVSTVRSAVSTIGS